MKPKVTDICIAFYYKGYLELHDILRNEKEIDIRLTETFTALKAQLNLGTALIFESGYINVVGLKTIEDIENSVNEIKNLLSRHGYNTKISKPIRKQLRGYLKFI